MSYIYVDCSNELHRARHKIGFLNKDISTLKIKLQTTENDKCDLRAQVSSQRQTIDSLKNRQLTLEEKSGNRKKEIKILLQKIEKLQEKKITSADSKLRDAQRLHDQASKLLEVNDRLKEENTRLQKMRVNTISNPMEMPQNYQNMPELQDMHVPSYYQPALEDSEVGHGLSQQSATWCDFESGSSCSDDSSRQESENNDMASLSGSFYEHGREDDETYSYPDEPFQHFSDDEYDSDPEDSEVVFYGSPWCTARMYFYDGSSQYESENEQEEDEASVQSDDTYVTAPLLEEPDNSECHNESSDDLVLGLPENVSGYPVDLPFPIEEELCVIDSDVEGVKQDRLCKLIPGTVTGQNEHAHSLSVSVQQMQASNSPLVHEEFVEVTFSNNKCYTIPKPFFDLILRKIKTFRICLKNCGDKIGVLENEITISTAYMTNLEKDMDRATISLQDICERFRPTFLEIFALMRRQPNVGYYSEHWCEVLARMLQIPHARHSNIYGVIKEWLSSDYRTQYKDLIDFLQESNIPEWQRIATYLKTRLPEMIAKMRLSRGRECCIACNKVDCNEAAGAIVDDDGGGDGVFPLEESPHPDSTTTPVYPGSAVRKQDDYI